MLVSGLSNNGAYLVAQSFIDIGEQPTTVLPRVEVLLELVIPKLAVVKLVIYIVEKKMLG